MGPNGEELGLVWGRSVAGMSLCPTPPLCSLAGAQGHGLWGSRGSDESAPEVRGV